ncbi:MAG: hypothetical protein ACI9SE_002901, partial [Neolewinella sp.]
DAFARRILRMYARPSNADGAVRLTPALGSSAEGFVFVRAKGYAPIVAAGTLEAGKEMRVKLVLESRITGRIVDSLSGAGLAGVPLSLQEIHAVSGSDELDPLGESVSAADGSFSFQGLAAGRYQVIAGSGASTVRRSQRVKVAAGKSRELTVMMPRGVTVGGKMIGNALPTGLRVALLRAEQPLDGQSPRALGALAAWNFGESVPVVDGAFRLPNCGPGERVLCIVVPVPARTGAALCVPIVSVLVGSKDLSLSVDLEGRRPGVLKGRVTSSGLAVPRGRLAVVAIQEFEHEDVFADMTPAMRTRWALVEPDGSYRMPAGPGRCDLLVVDVATGVILTKDAETVQVAPNEATQHDLRVAIAGVKVQYDKEAAGRGAVGRVDLQVADDADARGWFRASSWGSPGLDLVDISRELQLLVPPGEVGLRLSGCASRIDFGFRQYEESGGSASMSVATEGEVSMVVLEVPVPAELDE